jgi:hypothetical protein
LFRVWWRFTLFASLVDISSIIVLSCKVYAQFPMTFDVSRTETFVPFLWILLKSITVLSLFSLISTAALCWDVVDVVRETPHATVGATVSTLPATRVWDRLIAVVLLLLVLCERGMDMYVASRSEVSQKVTKKTLTGLNTHIVNDMFVFFCLTYTVKTQRLPVSPCMAGSYGYHLTSGLWCIAGLALFLGETKLKRKMLYHEQERARRASGNGSTLDAIQTASPVLCYVVIVLLMAISLTSPCLHVVYTDMLYAEYCLRLMLYASYVCGRCYTQGTPGDSYVDEIPNLVLFGWLVLLPMAVVYSSLMISLLAYIRLVTTPGSSRKNTNMILPSTVISDTKTIHPTSTMPNMTSYISSSSAHLEETRSNVAENSADFLAKLQNIEESMLQHQTPSLNSSVPKASFASKRRTAPLF